jgi:HB1, ASXL, restriction endonuclease HTH domain
MDMAEAVVTVLREQGEPVHWTVIQDVALRQGYIDPFTESDVRKRLLATLAELVERGEVEKTAVGVYRIADD